MVDRKITSFEQLTVWQESANLAVKVYELTKRFPSSERFALSDQVQRSVVSVSANIAEGFGRAGKNEKLQFYNIAYGSLLETKSHLLIAEKLNYLDETDMTDVFQLIIIIQKLINASKTAIVNRST